MRATVPGSYRRGAEERCTVHLMSANPPAFPRPSQPRQLPKPQELPYQPFVPVHGHVTAWDSHRHP
jgi:hypothetical protein